MTAKEEHDMMIENNTLLKQVHSAVFGNGQPGLKTRMERIEGGWRFLKGAMLVLGSVFAIYAIFA